jgi:hypothetical protein
MVVGDESTAARTHSTAISPDVRQSAAVAVARFFFFFLAAPALVIRPFSRSILYK